MNHCSIDYFDRLHLQGLWVSKAIMADVWQSSMDHAVAVARKAGEVRYW